MVRKSNPALRFRFRDLRDMLALLNVTLIRRGGLMSRGRPPVAWSSSVVRVPEPCLAEVESILARYKSLHEYFTESLSSKGVKMLGSLPYPFPSCIVPFSGGKDSQTCLELAVAEFGSKGVLALFCDTAYEHPMTYQHVNSVCAELNVTLITLSAGTVAEKCEKYSRFPRGGARFCTEELKIRPAKYFYKCVGEVFGCAQIWYGMREEESAARKARYAGKLDGELYAPHEVMPSKYPQYLAALGIMMRLPILYWSESDVYTFLQGRENPLYRAGFDRVGCFPCLASGDAHQLKAFQFDQTGQAHYDIAVKIADISGFPVFSSKGHSDKNGVWCMFCSI